jgi:hypothetical protein
VIERAMTKTNSDTHFHSHSGVPAISGHDPSSPLGRPVLLEGEDAAAYDRLLAKVTAAVRPMDIIEEFWVRDVVDLMWEALRLRRLKANLLHACAAKGLRKVLEPLVEFGDLSGLVEAWYAREPDALQEVEELLAKAGLNTGHVMAQTLSHKLDDVERIERMLAQAEGRRHVVLREVDRHRAAVASRLRLASEEIQDAEFSDAAIGQTTSEAA